MYTQLTYCFYRKTLSFLINSSDIKIGGILNGLKFFLIYDGRSLSYTQRIVIYKFYT